MFEKSINAELLVAPINFEQRLESAKELSCFLPSRLKNRFDSLALLLEYWIVVHPRVRVKEVGVWSIPVFTNSVFPVPVLENFGIR